MIVSPRVKTSICVLAILSLCAFILIGCSGSGPGDDSAAVKADQPADSPTAVGSLQVSVKWPERGVESAEIPQSAETINITALQNGRDVAWASLQRPNNDAVLDDVPTGTVRIEAEARDAAWNTVASGSAEVSVHEGRNDAVTLELVPVLSGAGGVAG